MKKDCRINLRLSDAQFRKLELRAGHAEVSAPEYVRELIRNDLSANTDAVIRRLARMIIFSSVAVRHLYTTIGHPKELRTVKKEVEHLLADLGGGASD